MQYGDGKFPKLPIMWLCCSTEIRVHLTLFWCSVSRLLFNRVLLLSENFVKLYWNGSAMFTKAEKKNVRAASQHQILSEPQEICLVFFKMHCSIFNEHSLFLFFLFFYYFLTPFKAGRVSVQDDERSGRPITSKMLQNCGQNSWANSFGTLI